VSHAAISDYVLPKNNLAELELFPAMASCKEVFWKWLASAEIALKQ